MTTQTKTTHAQSSTHSVTPIPFKAHKVNWLSAELIENVFENSYGSTVRKLNQLIDQRPTFDRSANTAGAYTTIDRKLLDAANDITLHETYFNSIGDESESARTLDPKSKLAESIALAFGSIDALFDELIVLSSNQDQAIDWILLLWCENISQLISMPLNDQSVTAFGAQPVLTINLQQTVYANDFGKDRQKYVEAFLKCIHWGRVSHRYETVRQQNAQPTLAGNAEAITVNELKQLSEQQNDSPLVLDVRHTDDCERYRHRITGTQWRDSFDVASWSSELPKDKPIVVYCMYGFWVSQDVATELRAQGYEARTLIGGINSWRAMGYDSSEF